MAAPTLDRRDVLSQLFPSPQDYLFVSGPAGSARDAAGPTDDGAHLFTLAGPMGPAVPPGLGPPPSPPTAPAPASAGPGAAACRPRSGS